MRQFMKTECGREAGEAMGFPLSRSVVGGCREDTKSRRRGGGGPLRLGEHVFRVVAQRYSQVRQLNLRGAGTGRREKRHSEATRIDMMTGLRSVCNRERK